MASPLLTPGGCLLGHAVSGVQPSQAAMAVAMGIIARVGAIAHVLTGLPHLGKSRDHAGTFCSRSGFSAQLTVEGTCTPAGTRALSSASQELSPPNRGQRMHAPAAGTLEPVRKVVLPTPECLCVLYARKGLPARRALLCLSASGTKRQISTAPARRPSREGGDPYVSGEAMGGSCCSAHEPSITQAHHDIMTPHGCLPVSRGWRRAMLLQGARQGCTGPGQSPV